MTDAGEKKKCKYCNGIINDPYWKNVCTKHTPDKLKTITPPMWSKRDLKIIKQVERATIEKIEEVCKETHKAWFDCTVCKYLDQLKRGEEN